MGGASRTMGGEVLGAVGARSASEDGGTELSTAAPRTARAVPVTGDEPRNVAEWSAWNGPSGAGLSLSRWVVARRGGASGQRDSNHERSGRNRGRRAEDLLRRPVGRAKRLERVGRRLVGCLRGVDGRGSSGSRRRQRGRSVRDRHPGLFPDVRAGEGPRRAAKVGRRRPHFARRRPNRGGLAESRGEIRVEFRESYRRACRCDRAEGGRRLHPAALGPSHERLASVTVDVGAEAEPPTSACGASPRGGEQDPRGVPILRARAAGARSSGGRHEGGGAVTRAR